MNCPPLTTSSLARRKRERGSVLIIVMWVAFGLVSVALYFAHSMIFELRAADNRVASLEAEQAIEGAARYALYVLGNMQQPGQMPDLASYQREAVPVGDAMFWFIGRNDRQVSLDDPFFSLVDEASKLNLNKATNTMLEALPRMTTELAAAIQDWRDSDDTVSASGAESDAYSRLRPPYKCKNAPFETVDELRLVLGAHLDILYGEDLNLNGVLDPNENDGNISLPDDNRDGRLDPGVLEYVTVYSRESNTKSDGTNRVNVSSTPELAALLQQRFGAKRAGQILPPGGGGRGPSYTSVLDFYFRSGMTADEFSQIAADITASTGPYVEGLVNVNTASAEVLTCIPGIGQDKAASIVGYRQSNPDKLTSLAWVKDLLDQASATAAGPYLTGQTYQYSADIAAVGHHGRGYRRTRFIFDTSSGTPKIIFRQDLSHLGWALGRRARETMLLAKTIR